MGRAAKRELVRALKQHDRMPGGLGKDARLLFYSLHTRWCFLRKLALAGRDICGPQTAGVRDVKMLAAEGSAAHAL